MNADLARLSLNQATCEHATLAEAIAACVANGVPQIGVWRHKLEGDSEETWGARIRDSGLRCSSLCRGGMFPAATAEERRRHIEDNLKAIDQAVGLGTEVLVLVCGGQGGCDLDSARAMVLDGIAAIEHHAKKCGVRLAIEPLHPMFTADRSVIVTLEQANDLCDKLALGHVGIAIDVYHVWWDPNVYREIARARGRILGFHVNDWIAPPPEVLRGRGMMGDGVIELKRLRAAVEQAGYTGPIEVEIFNERLWSKPAAEIVERVKKAYLAVC
ncbi:MAG TPA: sugar phosphate isomerase/epimerase family protein [Bryobacteraceae bacterium]|jgi:sugar phosphate isomerase/epimerase|nr:sugar phosphate isomerase/epimerase family protein [Bryobacteraceae bacterium]